MPIPIGALAAPGLPVYRFPSTYLTAGTSPRTGTIQLPSYGWWLVEVSAAFQNTNNVGSVLAACLFYNGVSNIKALKTSIIGSAGFSAGSDMNQLSLSDPDASGIITVTVGWATTATSRTPWVQGIGRQLTENSIAESTSA